MKALPSQLLEMSNGVLLVTLAWMMLFNAIYLWRKLKQLVWVRAVYVECKGAIATLVFLGGLFLRTAPVWLTRHLANMQANTDWLVIPGRVSIIAGTLVIIIGGFCWIRIVMPVQCHHLSWWIMAASAVVFGVGMAW